MGSWLFKSDPETYGWDELKKKQSEVWDGVKNPLALKHLRSIRKGDEILIYHSGKDKAIVGIARALGTAYPDPADKTGKGMVIDLAPLEDFTPSISLSQIKNEPDLKNWELVRMSRLSVMPLGDKERRCLERLRKQMRKP